ncbi:ATP-binding protein [Desulfosporosinus sp. Sb-LF]|uniref:ATP-binding protein n=1 Tax=Desulfosporosinus sp. Sb-LF TaxID=2560027 RepID=UPI00107FA2D7|nr:ATP-binding protein [Desulfosporosinus sp. Sb-LF]TGE33859.1 two-component sensor histidine kinase [Desulfosporosinus sp. Sb-LF]
MGFFQSQHITENYEYAIEQILTYENYNRTRKFSVILFLASIILLFVDHINKVEGLWIISDGYKYLFYSHVILGFVTLFYSLVSYRIIVPTAKGITRYHKFHVIVFSLFILTLTAVTSGWIDQKIHGQITVYVIGSFMIAVMYSYKPRITALLYGLSFVAFMILLTISQKDLVIRHGHFVNASLVVVISYFLSNVLHKLKHQDMLHKCHLEDLVTERTKELQTANDSLTQEILERKRAEIEMAKLDRLNLIGEMAASISHEVRNPMTTVKGFLQLLRHKQNSRDREHFDLMIEELDRANSILSEFLSISRTKSTIFESHNINDIVTSTLPLVQADAQTNDNLLTVELNNVPNLQLNIQEIRQLLLNLVRNGLEAMSGGGQLRIRTFSTNSEVALAVSDEGKGIEQFVLEKLGTPFFTTKEKGTGLGLAVCYGIVSRHNGRINVETSPIGTTFNVYFELS